MGQVGGWGGLGPIVSFHSMLETGVILGQSDCFLVEPDFSLCWPVSNLTFVYAALVQSMPQGQGTRRGRGHGPLRAV